MVNRHRGEVAIELGGRRRAMRLTLGGLAELEDALQAGDLAGLAERLASGRLSARDILRIVAIGLKGAGNALSDDEIAQMTPDTGLEPLVAAIVAMLAAAFGQGEGREEAQGTARP
jgi:hypothetical protein